MCRCHDQHCGCNCHCHRHGRHHDDCQCDCRHHGGECECGGKFERRFATRAERIVELEQYLQDLKAEIQAVEEHLAELKAAK